MVITLVWNEHFVSVGSKQIRKPKAACRLHGRVSTGPRTPEGLEAIRRSRTIHGFYSAAAVLERRAARRAVREFRQLLQMAWQRE